jgi:phage-related tail fiber protein
VTPGTFTKFTVNSKGVITYAEYLHDSDIPTLDWGKITTGKPTTLAGYGITDGQPLNDDLTAIAALTGTGYPLRASDGTWSLQNISAMADQTYTPGTYTKVTVNIKGIVTGVATLSASDIPNLDWSKITSGKPTTVSGYGITITNSDLPNNIDWVKLVNKPTTLAGYGITDGQTLNANLTAISAFSGTTTGFPKRASDGSWSLQDIPTLDTTGVTAGTWTKVTVDVYGRVTLGTVLNSSDIPNLDWSKISTGKPTTLAGYGITDGQGLNANLTSISGLSGTGYLLRSGGGVWSVGLIDTTLLPNSGVTAGTYTKVTVNIKGIVTGVATLAASDIPNLDWTKITSGKPTTLAGYGITDAQALNANLTSISAFTGASTGFAVRASDGSWSLQSISVLTPTGVSPGTYTKVTVDLNGVVTAATTLLASDIPNLDWTKITTGKPTTLAGYGITDGQPLNADLTAIAALTGTGYPKRASDGSWTLDTLTTLDDIVSPGTYTKVTVTAQGRVSSGGSLVASDIPNLDWSKITTGIPSTLSGYGITDAQQKLGRSSIQVVTASLAVGATEQGSVALGKTFMLHKVVASAPCWIRIYATTAYRTADALRDVSTDPTGEHGVIAELLLVSGNLAYDLFPMVIGSNMDSPISTAIAYSITNTGLSTAAITVTFTRTVLET